MYCCCQYQVTKAYEPELVWDDQQMSASPHVASDHRSPFVVAMHCAGPYLLAIL